MRVSYTIALLFMCVGIMPLQAWAGQDNGETNPDSTTSRVSKVIWVMDPIVIEGRRDDLVGISISASEGRVGIADLRLRPMLRAGELLEAVPGMIMTQHSGGGKANQMFVRGFNLDHGTDFNTVVSGMPVNMPTHGHGQGYTDINFVIPELVDHLKFRKGTYYADIGDFSSAGSATFELVREVPESFLRFVGGEFNYLRGVGAASGRAGAGTWLIGGEMHTYDGPWTLPEDLQRVSGLARYSWTSGVNEMSFLALGYAAKWDATDQIPLRSVEDGLISRFGHIDPTVGGETNRYSLSFDWNRNTGETRHRATVYGFYYDLDLWSNFTYLLVDSVNGDQFEQFDERFCVGGSYDITLLSGWFGAAQELTLGVQSRTDFIQKVGLYNTRERQRLSTVREDEVTETGTGVYATLDSRWTRWFRSNLGLRGDYYHFDVTSDFGPNSGTASDAQISPKLALTFGPFARTELYANAGLGFHTNDARGTTITIDPVSGDPVDPVDPIVESRGAEFGVRTNPVSNYRMTLAVWGLELDSELLYVGDAGNTEPSDPSRRYGIEWNNYFEPRNWLAIDFDYAYSHARFVDVAAGEDYIPGALEHVVAAGLTVKPLGSSGWFGSARLRYFADYPLIEDNSQRAGSTTIVNLGLGYQVGRARIGLLLFNLFDAEDSDIEYFYASRLPGEPVDGLDDRHFHPVESRMLRAGVTVGF